MIDSFTDELLSLQAPSQGLGKQAGLFDSAQQKADRSMRVRAMKADFRSHADTIRARAAKDGTSMISATKALASKPKPYKPTFDMQAPANQPGMKKGAAVPLRLYGRLGGGAAAAGALEHAYVKRKQDSEGMHPMLQRKGSTLDAAKRVGGAGLGLAALLHLIASKGKKAK